MFYSQRLVSMANGEPRGAGYIFYNFQMSPNREQFYEPEQEPAPEVDNGWRWWNPKSWDNNNEEVAARREQNVENVYSEWERQLAEEEGRTPARRQVEAESGWNPFSYFADLIAQGQRMQGAANNPLIPGYGSESRQRERELSARQSELLGRRMRDREAVVGTPRAVAEVAAPMAITAAAAVPIGTGFRALPQAAQTSRVGQMFAPMTGRFSSKFQWLVSRGHPAMIASGAVANEVPGNVPSGVADEVAANAAFGAVGSIIMRRWPTSIGSVAGLVAGAGAGLGSAIAVGNQIDEERQRRIREYAFRDQERLNYTYSRNPEMFPEFVPIDRTR
jgi:hypothetical protein